MTGTIEAEATNKKLPRIGGMIEDATGIPFNAFGHYKPTLGLEIAMAAIAAYPDYRDAEGRPMRDIVNDLLLKQAGIRIDAVKSDVGHLLEGMLPQGLEYCNFQLVKMVDAVPANVRDREQHQAVLDRAREEVKHLGWLRAEGVSNATNFARDTLTTLSGAPDERLRGLSDAEKKVFRDALSAAETIADALIHLKPISPEEKERLIAALDAGMDLAVEINPAIKEIKAYKENYDHCRFAMRQGIGAGIDANNQLHSQTMRADDVPATRVEATGAKGKQTISQPPSRARGSASSPPPPVRTKPTEEE